MEKIKKVKIQNILDSHIPDFIENESPLLKEFLSQYYISQENQTGIVDLAINLSNYKSIDNFNPQSFYVENNPCILDEDISTFSSTIKVNHTIGFPEKYGLIKIDDEIITYTGITTNTFTGCIRGFSGLSKENNNDVFVFSSTDSVPHTQKSTVLNLNFQFFQEFFKKFKEEFLPGFEDRNFVDGLNYKEFLIRAKDFYSSKGTDISFKILFKVLYGSEINVVNPQDYLFTPSSNNYIKTRNILVEKIQGNENVLSLKGKGLYQKDSIGRTASATIYNVEYRPDQGKGFFEISLDPESFVYDFVSTKKTNIIENVLEENDILYVDSTSGFSDNGSLIIYSENLSEPIIVEYYDKTLNQFNLNSPINYKLNFGDYVIENNLAYSHLDDGTKVEFRICNNISSVDVSKTFGMRINDKIILSSIGKNLNDDPIVKNWNYNIPSKISSYRKTTSSNFNGKLNTIPSEIQNVYFDEDNKSYYISASGFPKYKFAADNATLSIVGTGTSIFNTTENHNLLTGERIYIIGSSNSGIQTGFYYVTKLTNNKISLSFSNFDVAEKKYIESSSYEQNVAFKYGYQDESTKSLKPLLNQNIFKKITRIKDKSSQSNIEKRTTNNRKIGILRNGVEICSPSFFNESVYFGKVEFVDVVSNGSDYDVINFPQLEIKDGSNNSAKCHVNLVGSLKKINVLSPGIGYQTTPKISLIGGNGSGAIIDPILKKEQLASTFNSDSTGISLNPTNIITFLSKHGFSNGEGVIYDSNGNDEISSLVNDSIYYVHAVNSTQVSIHERRDDALVGINTIDINSYGNGFHIFKSQEYKNVIDDILVLNGGEGYSNRFVNVYSPINPELIYDNTGYTGISTFDNYIFAKNHNFKDLDIVNYSSSGDLITGLSTTNQYYITVIDYDRFTLSEIDNSLDPKKNYYAKKYVNITGVGTGEHTFSYPPISLKIESLSGTASTTIIEPLLDPVVLGEIENVYLSNPGNNYGSTDVINFNKSPFINFTSPTQISILKPKVLNGSITNVEIINPGHGYSKDIDLIVVGNGKFAKLYPIIENGRIVQVQILNSGKGYDNKTEIIIEKRGSGAKFYGNITEWTINQVKKNESIIASIPDGEGMLIPSDNPNSLQYINFYPPSIFMDELNDNGSVHSPILGWAYDGNPIYGPYGYPNIDGSGLVKKLLNGYKEKDTKTLSDNKIRPSGFPQGFFIQDYEYEYDSNNDLDEYNGRYCVTPEFPEGTYAYFYSIDDALNPKFPYLIGNLFKNNIDDYNYNTLINQKTVDLNSLNLTRNTGNYDFDNYDIFTQLTQKNKESYIVNSITSSGIGSIVIDYPGDDYKVNDQIIFDNTNTDGSGINAFVSRVGGKKINNFTIGVGTFYDVNFVNINNKIVGVASTYHSINDYDSIKISNVSSSEYSYIEGSKVVNIFNCQTNLQENLENQLTTGVSTYIVVNQTQGFNVDDYIKIENEVLKITNISSENSILFVDRFDSFSGIHSIGSIVKLLPRKFTIRDEDGFKLNAIENTKTYFNPSETIGFGTVGTYHEKIIGINTGFGEINYSQKNTIGINTTLIKLGDIISGQYVSLGATVTSIGINSIGIGVSHTFVSLGSTTNVYKISRSTYDRFTPQKSIYIPNHKFYTGQPLVYNSGLNGSGLIVSNVGSGNTFIINNNQVVYAVNLGLNFIGISTIGFSSSVGIGSTLNSLYFSDLNSNNIGKSHYFETKYPIVSATSEKYFINVSTANTHGLLNGDKIRFNYNPSLNEIVSFRYDPIIRKITTELITFDSSIGINTTTSEILIENNNFSTGDKIVYYNNGNNSIAGLINNQEYYVIKQNPNSIKLSNYYSSSLIGDYIILNSVGVGTHSFALINPPINVTKGNVLTFNLENVTQMDLRLYEDLEFTKELERLIYFESNGVYKLNTNLLPNREIYYNFVPYGNSPLEYKQISSDFEVFGRNKITIEENSFSQKEFKIYSDSENTFSINLNYKPEILSINDISSISYDTDSKFSSGPISKIKVNFQGRGYKKIPKIKEIVSQNGSGAILNAVSTEIGKIDVLENVKNIYDFPTDNTLTPFLSIPAVCKVKDICRIDYIGITSAGRGYNTPPTLKVVGRDDIILSAQIKNNSVSSVTVSKNANNLSVPLKIVTLKNSNGYDIDNIVVGYANTIVTLELINNPQSYPLINTGYGTTDIIFPFNVGDKIFIENCRIKSLTGDNYNSENYNYKFFTVVGVDTSNFTLTYSTDNVSNNFGTYYTDFGYGYVCNYKDIAKFEMNLIDDLSYKSGEVVKSNNFSAVVMENGWDNKINELRLIDCIGSLTIGSKLYGTESGLNGKILTSSSFLLKSVMGPYKNKIVKNSLDKGILNDYSIRISDNNYYQKFSYAINGEIPYLTWKNSVKSLIHPSGFKEFSDLNIVSKASTKLNPTVTSSSIDFIVNVDNLKSFNTKDNFCLVTESNQYEDGSIQNIVIGSENANVIGIGETFVGGVQLKPYILNKSNKVIKLDDISNQFTGITSSIGGNIVGLTSFKLKSNNASVFYLTFDSSNPNIIDIQNNIFNINNHNLQTGQKLYYNSHLGQKIGIKTTSLCESSIIIKNDLGYLSVASTSESNIITNIGSGIGSAIYENGYNNNISGIVGVGTTAPIGTLLKFFGTAYPFIPSSTSGLGTGAKFSVIFEYDLYTGSPLSTSVILRDGGSNYKIGDNVSIAGTFLNGTNPTNNLSFTVTKLTSTSVVGAANSTFNNISGISVSGNGSGAIFNISRDSSGSIKSTEIVNGGVGYALTDKIKILGTDIGGVSPADDYLISPTELGTNKLPSVVYVNKLNDNQISLSGISTELSNSQFDLINLGSGNQSLNVDNPNANSLIAVDNIIQSPIYLRNIPISLASPVGIGSTVIYLNSGISPITTLDTVKLENEYLKINSVGGIGTNTLEVERGFFGSIATSHTIDSQICLVRGDYNIVNDVIYFSTAPYGSGSLINSSFQGRVFSRSYDQLNAPNDTNIILDDISSDFTGISATSFTLKSNNNNVVGLFTDTNGGVDINNNPIILINNIPQISGKDYTIDTTQTNKINFIGGTPKAGKIVRIGLTTGFGYQPLVGASASISVSSAGTISNVYVKGNGSGYRIPPQVSISSTQGSGAIITSSVGAGGTIILSITNPGSGYTTSPLPKIKITEPPAYSNLPLVYSTGYSGLGTSAKASVVVGNASNIINFNLDETGYAYKVGDVLAVSGITTNPNAGSNFNEFKITVLEVMTDKFSGFYPGQFIQFEDISSYFNGTKKSFVLYYKNNLGKIDQISLKSISGSDINLENNLIVYINDIIQEPGVSYKFNGSRILFTEPPKAKSKCTILFYRGSDLDVEQIDPPKTIKEGDSVQINENQMIPYDVSQLERIVKTINSPENFDTFVYDAVGIDTNQSNSRPLSWTKQTKDRIVNGVLYSKSRPNLSSRIIPTTSLIKNVSTTDSEIYVVNAFPLFKKVDNIEESLTDVIICENKEVSSGIATAYVSSASTISSIIFSDNGSGYGKTTIPRLSIPLPTRLKDPIKNWTNSSGISTIYSFNSINVGNSVVSIGNSNILGLSTNGSNWSQYYIPIGSNIDYQSIEVISNNNYIIVGSNGKIATAVGIGSTLSNWVEKTKLKIVNQVGEIQYDNSDYNKTLNSVSYLPYNDTISIVGSSGTVFYAQGIGATSFIETKVTSYNLNSVTNNGALFVMVGDNGYIGKSIDSKTWIQYQPLTTNSNLNKVIWTQNKFIIVGDNGYVAISTDSGNSWETKNTNISDNLKTINYYKDDLYTALTSNGELYYSFDLINWEKRSTNQTNKINDLIYIDSLGVDGRYIGIGTSGTIIYSDPIKNRAEAYANSSLGSITSTTITNGGFGYTDNLQVLVEQESPKEEKLISIKAKGDYGVIVGINTFPKGTYGLGNTTAPKIEFVLKSDYYTGTAYSGLNKFKNEEGQFVTYSQLQRGDYFTIFNGNSTCGHAVTGISTDLGGLSNYPNSKIGTAGTAPNNLYGIDGVYRAEHVVSDAISGIVTVTCHLYPINYFSNIGYVEINVGTAYSNYYGNYSWGKIYGYQNRQRKNPQSFIVNSDDGFSGLSTAPEIYRTRGLI